MLGTLLMLAVIGYLLYRVVTKTQSPPAISLQDESVQRSGAGYLVRLVTYNDGDQPAAALMSRVYAQRRPTHLERESWRWGL